MFAVDTNILVYAADEDSPFHEPCRTLLERCRRESSPWYVTWGVLYEFLRVVTHPQVLGKPWSLDPAWGFVGALLDSPGLGLLTPTELHRDVASQVFAELPRLAGNSLHDAHVAILMREHGVSRIYTRDTGFHRFPFLEPIDPAA